MTNPWRIALVLAAAMPYVGMAQVDRSRASPASAEAPAQTALDAARSEARAKASRKAAKAPAGKGAEAGPTVWRAPSSQPGPAWSPEEPVEHVRGRCGG